MDMVKVGCRVEFQYGHRIPKHAGKCSRLHGHNAVVEVVMEADAASLNDLGMVVDFSAVKAVLDSKVRSTMDHRTLVECTDTELQQALLEAGDVPYVLPNGVTATAEGIVRHIRDLIEEPLQKTEPRCRLVSVRLYETPSCWAEVKGRR